ncbi:MAG TPA: hypothetical protein VHE56_06490 [Mycobacteriales bacterium]|nr:hypothetical protein [Mycobacteriales bacterium]
MRRWQRALVVGGSTLGLVGTGLASAAEIRHPALAAGHHRAPCVIGSAAVAGRLQTSGAGARSSGSVTAEVPATVFIRARANGYSVATNTNRPPRLTDEFVVVQGGGWSYADAATRAAVVAECG